MASSRTHVAKTHHVAVVAGWKTTTVRIRCGRSPKAPYVSNAGPTRNTNAPGRLRALDKPGLSGRLSVQIRPPALRLPESPMIPPPRNGVLGRHRLGVVGWEDEDGEDAGARASANDRGGGRGAVCRSSDGRPGTCRYLLPAQCLLGSAPGTRPAVRPAAQRP